MFDFAWSEIALIGIVALVAIGPKDMPVAIRAAAKAMKKAKSMAAEFQTHVDEMVREADLHEVRDQINSIRRMDLRGHLERTVDPDGSIRSTLRDDPFKTPPTPAPAPPAVPLVGEAEAAQTETVQTETVQTGALQTGAVQTVDVRPVHEVALPPEPAPPVAAEVPPPPPHAGAA